MKLIKCLTKSNMAIKITTTKQLKSASPTKMKRYQGEMRVILDLCGGHTSLLH